MKKRTVIVLIVCVVLLIFPIVLNIQDLVAFSAWVQRYVNNGFLDQMWGWKYNNYYTHLQYAIILWIEFFVLISIFLSLLLIIIVNLSPKIKDNLNVKIQELRKKRKEQKINEKRKKLEQLQNEINNELDEGKPE